MNDKFMNYELRQKAVRRFITLEFKIQNLKFKIQNYK